jgi:hypothetical protein
LVNDLADGADGMLTVVHEQLHCHFAKKKHKAALAASSDGVLRGLARAFGSFGGQLPAAEVLAALAVSAVGAALLLSDKLQWPLPALGTVLGSAVAEHAMLHGQEASRTSSWCIRA